jgi:hypothetical protein
MAKQTKGRTDADRGESSAINRKLSANNERLRVYKRNGLWLVAHLVRDEGVAGSNPATPTTT